MSNQAGERLADALRAARAGGRRAARLGSRKCFRPIWEEVEGGTP
jgi:hypothetical protein